VRGDAHGIGIEVAALDGALVLELRLFLLGREGLAAGHGGGNGGGLVMLVSLCVVGWVAVFAVLAFAELPHGEANEN
jgi:hypothetical protein